MSRAGWVACAAVTAAALAAAWWLTEDPSLEHDSAIDALFDSRLLIGWSRLLVLAAVVYLLASVVVRVTRGQWARGAGPVETDAPTQALADDQADLQAQLLDARATIDDLQDRLTRCLEARVDATATMGPPRDTASGDARDQGERPT